MGQNVRWEGPESGGGGCVWERREIEAGQGERRVHEALDSTGCNTPCKPRAVSNGKPRHAACATAYVSRALRLPRGERAIDGREWKRARPRRGLSAPGTCLRGALAAPGPRELPAVTGRGLPPTAGVTHWPVIEPIWKWPSGPTHAFHHGPQGALGCSLRRDTEPDPPSNSGH